MAKVTVDGVEVEIANGSSVLQAAEAAGREVPRFCYHERLSVAGNCRMCLVEIEKIPKPVASCGQPVADGMVVKTDTDMVRKARRGVMEFLLINHPLDCPICDQGGECDLQDEAVGYGRDHSRYDEGKRAVAQPDWGPLVRTTMTRCIHCTRCIRFCSEVAGVPELGAVKRGENMEVGTYVDKALSSELSGNIIDLCPVGALTAKPQAFSYRSWEFRKTDSVDVLDAVGANIRLDARGAEVLRILPRTNDEVNEEWLGDKSRFSVDGLKRRRLDRPWVRQNGKLRPASWEEAFAAIAGQGEIRGAGAAGRDCRQSVRCREHAGVERDDGGAGLGQSRLPAGWRGVRCLAPGFLSVQHHHRRHRGGRCAADRRRQSAPRGAGAECPHPQALGGRRLSHRHHRRAGRADLCRDRTGAHGPQAFGALFDGSHHFADILKTAKKPMLILGAGALARPDGAAVQAAAWKLASQYDMLSADWHGFNLLHHAAARVGGLDLGFLPGEGRQGHGTDAGRRRGCVVAAGGG